MDSRVPIIISLLLFAGVPVSAQTLAPPRPAGEWTIPSSRFALPEPMLVAPSELELRLPEQVCSPGRSRLGTGTLQVVGGTAAGLGGVALLSGAAVIVAIVLVFADIQMPDPVPLAYPVYVLGSSATVYWIGEHRGFGGRFWPTLAGGVLGFGAPGAVVGYHLSDRSDYGCDMVEGRGEMPIPIRKLASWRHRYRERAPSSKLAARDITS